MANGRWIGALMPVLMLAVGTVAAAAQGTPGDAVAKLFDAGDYTGARGLANRLIEDFEAGTIIVPTREMASIYVSAACLADLFRDPGYVEEVDRRVAQAVALDPNVEPGPAVDRPLVRESLARAREAYRAAHGPAGRRWSVAVSAAAAGPTSLRWPDAVITGIRLGFAPLAWLDVEGEVGLPLGAGPVAGVELRLGAAFRPVFEVGRLLPLLSASYVASSGASWTHGLAVSAGAEVAGAQGWWLRATVELARVDIVATPVAAPGSYPAIGGGGTAAAFSFPRLAVSAAYSF
jgi:hypothetical protein